MPHRIFHVSQEVQETLADTGTAISITTASLAWLSQANELLTACATIIAIVAGIYAANYHRTKTKLLKKASEDQVMEILENDDTDRNS